MGVDEAHLQERTHPLRVSLPMHCVLTLDSTDRRELTGALDDYRDEEQVSCSLVDVNLLLQLIR